MNNLLIFLNRVLDPSSVGLYITSLVIGIIVMYFSEREKHERFSDFTTRLFSKK